MSSNGPRTLIRYWRSYCSMVMSAMFWLPATPALLIMMSIWNLPVLGCEKWFLVVFTMCAAPPGDPMSAWTARQVTLCSEVSFSESAAVMDDDESLV